MIRRMLLPFVAVLFSVALLVAQAQRPENPAPPSESDQTGAESRQPGEPANEANQVGRESMQEQTVQGTIQKVDTVGNNITIRTNNNDQQTLSMDASTAVKVNGKASTVADLKPGQDVTITMDGQKAVAVDVSEGVNPLH